MILRFAISLSLSMMLFVQLGSAQSNAKKADQKISWDSIKANFLNKKWFLHEGEIQGQKMPVPPEMKDMYIMVTPTLFIESQNGIEKKGSYTFDSKTSMFLVDADQGDKMPFRLTYLSGNTAKSEQDGIILTYKSK